MSEETDVIRSSVEAPLEATLSIRPSLRPVSKLFLNHKVTIVSQSVDQMLVV